MESQSDALLSVTPAGGMYRVCRLRWLWGRAEPCSGPGGRVGPGAGFGVVWVLVLALGVVWVLVLALGVMWVLVLVPEALVGGGRVPLVGQ